MPTNPLTRRLITVPVVYVSLAVTTLLLPILLMMAGVVDFVRWVMSRRPAMTLRMLAFGWLYLLGEAWAILVLALLGALPKSLSLRFTYMAQRAWLDWNFASLSFAFSLRFRAQGESEIAPGPIILLSRHASMIDTMLPGRYVVGPHGIKLRYVLKKELLVDPALDIGGNRLPNHFIDRAGDSEEEMQALRDLARGLPADEGVLIYPEGTRYTEDKRVAYVSRLREQGGAVGEISSGLRRVLPPRPGGTLALLDASDADIVFLAHRGLEGFAHVTDLWSGGLVGSVIDLQFWRVPRSEIPDQPDDRVEWLFRQWAGVDEWVSTSEAGNL